MGTAGHMAHPFDVERILTGQDLIDYINDAVLRLQNKEIAGSVKWEGINTSFKLVTNEDGSKEFRMDRGTSEIGSVLGFDASAAIKKWGQEHGMAKAIPKLLNIFNEALPLIEPELKKLGMWGDPTKYFNTEYIEGKSNVIDYRTMDIPPNILAIHGINQFYEKEAQPWRVRAGTSMRRPGLPRPVDPETGKPDKDAKGIEIPYDRKTLATLIEKVQPIADASDPPFKIYGDVPVEFDPEIDLDLEGALDDTQLSVEISPDDIKSYSLRKWLKLAKNPKDKMITRADGKQVGAMSKDAYLAVLRSTEAGSPSLKEYLASEEDTSDAINGAVFYHALRVLGQQLKAALTSEVGNLGRHEGVVLRGLEDFLVKFTGEFIVQGLASAHGDRASMLQKEARYNPDWRRTGYEPRSRLAPETVALIAGGFKPPHRGHLEMIQHYADKTDQVKVYIGAKPRPLKGDSLGREISAEQSKDVWEMYLADAGLADKVEIVIKREPMKAAYQALENAQRGQTILMGCGEKDTYYSPKVLDKYTPPGVQSTAAPCPNIIDKMGKPYKAEYVRNAIRDEDINEFKKFVPKNSLRRTEEIFSFLQGGIKEMSSMGGGSVEGGMVGTGSKKGPWADLDVEKENQKQKENQKLKGMKEELVSEVVDYLLGITVG